MRPPKCGVIVFGEQFAERMVGASVVCIDGKFSTDPRLPYHPADIKLPKESVVYHVREVLKAGENELAIRLVEIYNQSFRHTNPESQETDMYEPCFLMKRFIFL